MNESPDAQPGRPRIAVVGGGIAGLSAAQRLHTLLPSAELRLLERSDRVGGPLDTIRRDGWLLERGADSFSTKLPDAVALCRELGVGEEIIGTNAQHRRALVVRGGRLLPTPAGFVLMRAQKISGVLRSPVLSLRGKLRLLAEPLIAAPAAVYEPDYDESVASFATRRLGRETFERLVQPLLAGIYVADAEKLSLAGTMPEFLAAEREFGSLTRALRRTPRDEAAAEQRRVEKDSSGARYGVFVSLRDGLSGLVRALVDALPAHAVSTGTQVDLVERVGESRWQLRLSGRSGPQTELFDGVVIAAPAPRAADLLAAVDVDLAAELGQIRYASSAVVGLVCRREQIEHPLDGFGFVVPAVEGRDLVAGSFASVKYPGRLPDDLVHLRAFVGGVLRPELVDRSDDELVALARRELEGLLGLRGVPLATDVARWRESMPQYDVGHVQRVDRLMARADALPRLALAGNAYRGVGIPQCIASGRAAAESVADQLSG